MLLHRQTKIFLHGLVFTSHGLGIAKHDLGLIAGGRRAVDLGPRLFVRAEHVESQGTGQGRFGVTPANRNVRLAITPLVLQRPGGV